MIKFIELLEKNVPTNPKLWSKFKSQAKSKFDVYPSAYANGWAAKQYKKAGGGWKSVSEELSEETGEQITIISEEGEKKKVKLGKDAFFTPWSCSNMKYMETASYVYSLRPSPCQCSSAVLATKYSSTP